jgi:hypothetical protein
MKAATARGLVLLAASTSLLVGGVLATGCSSASGGGDESTGTATSGALSVIDPALAAAATVNADNVSFPASSMSALSAHKAGDVIVSPAVDGSAGNTTGFLRKITGTSMQGDQLVVTTEQAALTDVVAEGEAHPAFNLPGDWNVVDLGEETIASRVTSLSAVDASLTSNELTIDAKLDSAHVELKPDLDFTMAFKDWSLSTAHFSATGTVDATAAVEMDVKVSGTVSSAGLAALQGYTAKVSKRLWSSGSYPLPTFYIGAIPVSMSVEMYMNAICWVNFKGYTGGELSLKASAKASATVDGAIDYASGTWTPSDNASVSGSGTVTLPDSATEDAICQVGPSFALSLYGAGGPELGVTAGLNVDSLAKSWNAKADVRAWVQGTVDILGYKDSFGPYTLYDYLGPQFASGT